MVVKTTLGLNNYTDDIFLTWVLEEHVINNAFSYNMTNGDVQSAAWVSMGQNINNSGKFNIKK